jgi:hypothetical protein
MVIVGMACPFRVIQAEGAAAGKGWEPQGGLSGIFMLRARTAVAACARNLRVIAPSRRLLAAFKVCAAAMRRMRRCKPLFQLTNFGSWTDGSKKQLATGLGRAGS